MTTPQSMLTVQRIQHRYSLRRPHVQLCSEEIGASFPGSTFGFSFFLFVLEGDVGGGVLVGEWTIMGNASDLLWTLFAELGMLY